MNLLSTLWLLVFKVADHESKTILFLQELDHFDQVVSYLSCVIECRKRKEKLLKYQYWRLWETAYFWSLHCIVTCQSSKEAFLTNTSKSSLILDQPCTRRGLQQWSVLSPETSGLMRIPPQPPIAHHTILRVQVYYLFADVKNNFVYST